MRITLCGSARFEDYFKFWNEMLSLAGHTVYTLSVYPSDKDNTKSWYDDEEKETLDKVHLAKIDNSDAIFVINAFAYLGESTLIEIEYAKSKGKTVYSLESWGKGCGIGSNHYQYVQDAAGRHGVLGTYSPIDAHLFKNIWSGDEILGGAGKLRSKVADAQQEFLKKVYHLEESANYL